MFHSPCRGSSSLSLRRNEIRFHGFVALLVPLIVSGGLVHELSQAGLAGESGADEQRVAEVRETRTVDGRTAGGFAVQEEAEV